MTRWICLSLVAVCLSACAPVLHYSPEDEEITTAPRWPTIVVVNKNIDRLILHDEVGRTLARVMSGETRCVALRGYSGTTMPVQFSIYVDGNLYPLPEFVPTDFEGGWLLEIATTPHLDVGSLRPFYQCKPRGRE